MAANVEDQSATQSDRVSDANARLPDGGPRYTETPPDPYAPDAPLIAEPWNAITASFFIFIVAAWAWRLRGRYRLYPFLCCCMPILLTGGIGGTLYHATRISKLFFRLDVIPISVLGLAGAVFMAVRQWGRHGFWFLPAVIAFYAGTNSFLFFIIKPANLQLAVNISYAALALVVLTP